MRIAVIGYIYSDSFAKCILHTLADMGHEVLSLYPGKKVLSRFFSDASYSSEFFKIHALETALTKIWPGLEIRQWQGCLSGLKEFQPEVILSVVWDMPTIILEGLKGAMSKEPATAIWCPDALTNFRRQYVFAAPWDYLFFKDNYIVDFCRKKLSLNAHLLPLACYPKWHRKVELSPDERKIYGCDITTAGGLYYYRAKFLEHFLQYQIKIWGPRPPKYVQSPVRKFLQGRYVGELEKAKAFNGAAIVLNNMHYAEIAGLNQRIFDACGCGAFQIVDANPVMAEYFIPGKELVCFQDLKELREIIPYYLNRPRERAEIAQAGYQRAHTEHTFRHRLEKMLAIIAEHNNAPEVS
jgi:spore maturation protein CgeB